MLVGNEYSLNRTVVHIGVQNWPLHYFAMGGGASTAYTLGWRRVAFSVSDTTQPTQAGVDYRVGSTPATSTGYSNPSAQKVHQGAPASLHTIYEKPTSFSPPASSTVALSESFSVLNGLLWLPSPDEGGLITVGQRNHYWYLMTPNLYTWQCSYRWSELQPS